MKMKNLLCYGAFLLIGLQTEIQPAAAGPLPFTIDPTRSSITLSGNVYDPAEDITLVFAAQGTGSLVTTYTGTIMVDLDPPNIQFPGGSSITANTSGTWQPAVGGGSGSAPADYGGKITYSLGPFTLLTGYFAGRGMEFDTTSSETTLTNGGFNSGLLTVTFLPGGTVDYNISGDIETTNGSSPLDGAATDITATAYLTNAYNVSNVLQKLTLNIPVNITNVSTESGDTITIILTGTVVAYAPSSDWPTPQITYSVNGEQLNLSWYSIPGQSFTLQAAQNLSGPWTAAPGPLTVNANTTSWTGNTTNTAQYFRVLATY
jgi:hypothetical protein